VWRGCGDYPAGFYRELGEFVVSHLFGKLAPWFVGWSRETFAMRPTDELASARTRSRFELQPPLAGGWVSQK
jgi:hypothetical protein